MTPGQWRSIICPTMPRPAGGGKHISIIRSITIPRQRIGLGSWLMEVCDLEAQSTTQFTATLIMPLARLLICMTPMIAGGSITITTGQVVLTHQARGFVGGVRYFMFPLV